MKFEYRSNNDCVRKPSIFRTSPLALSRPEAPPEASVHLRWSVRYCRPGWSTGTASLALYFVNRDIRAQATIPPNANVSNINATWRCDSLHAPVRLGEPTHPGYDSNPRSSQALRKSFLRSAAWADCAAADQTLQGHALPEADPAATPCHLSVEDLRLPSPGNDRANRRQLASRDCSHVALQQKQRHHRRLPHQNGAPATAVLRFSQL